MKKSSQKIKGLEYDLKNQVFQLKSEIKNKIDRRIRRMRNNTPTFQEQIFQEDVLTTIEDLGLDYYINIDDLYYALDDELTEQIKRTLYNSQPDPLNYQNNSIHLIQLRKDILKSLHGILTSRQLFALHHFEKFDFLKSYSPLEGITKVIRNLYYCTDLSDWDIPNHDDFLRLVGHMHPQILNELIEILDNSEVIKYCIWDPDNIYCYKLSDHDFLVLNYFHEVDEKINLINLINNN
jgi:hypothetical protein